MARLTLTTAGEDVDVGGNVTVIGTRTGGEVITITRGEILLDSSFNAGGDTIVLPGTSGSYTVRLDGSQAVIASSLVSVSIPLGTAGTAIQFAERTLVLVIDSTSGAAMLGEQTITTTAQPIAPMESAFGTNIFFELEPNDDIDDATAIDRDLLTSSPTDPNLTDPSAPSVILRGQIEDNNDVDFYAIHLNAGETITLDVDGAYNPADVSGLDSIIAILDSTGSVVAESDDVEALDPGSVSELDSYLVFEAPVSGTYYIGIISFDSEPGAAPEDYHLLVSIEGSSATLQHGIANDKALLAPGGDDLLSSLQAMAFA